jgi:hypothetical protein
MSNYLAIGAVSTTLRTLLNDRMELPPGLTDVTITVDTPTEDDDTDTARINLFLYRVAENEFLKNQEIPGHGNPAAYGHPPLSLTLHYLITPYGTTTETNSQFKNETRAQYLLGSAMRVLHDHAIITQMMRTDSGTTILDPVLLGEFEQIKLVLEPLGLEEVTKVWTALALPFRLSAGYRVSVIQIESETARRYPKPVGEPPEAGPRITAIPSTVPRIDRLLVRAMSAAPDAPPVSLPYARIGDTLVLKGTGFIKNKTQIRIGSVTLSPATLESQAVSVVIPDNPALQPGAQPVAVIREIPLGEPPVPHTAFTSNLVVFMLVPQVTGATLSGGTITIQGTRLYAQNVPCQTVIGDQVIEGEEYTQTTPSEIKIPAPSLAAGTYVVRVRVNGAESTEEQTITL